MRGRVGVLPLLVFLLTTALAWTCTASRERRRQGRLTVRTPYQPFGRFSLTGRRLLQTDYSVKQLFNYWNSTYAQWGSADYERYMTEFEQAMASLNLAMEAKPSTDEQLLQVHYFLRIRTQVPTAPGWSPERDRCAAGCYMHGTCNQEFGRCDCPRGRHGDDCATPLATDCSQVCLIDDYCRRLVREYCVNECNNRGTCVSQVCHCYPGYFGADCSLSTDYATNKTVILEGLGYTPNPRGPKIFIYEFPVQQTVWRAIWLDRPLNVLFWERMISLGLRVADPKEADYFFLPGCGRGCGLWNDKMNWILKHYGEYWARNNGSDHIWTHVGDWGRCEKQHSGEAQGMMAQMTQLTHFGLSADRSLEFGTPGNPFGLYHACYTPDRDIVIPAINGDLYPRYERFSNWLPEHKAQPKERKFFAFMSGALCGWNSPLDPPCPHRHYSFGVRQQLWGLLRGKPGFFIEKKVQEWAEDMAQAEFCFAPTGAGYGKRNAMAASLGCIPVIINDDVAQPFGPFLDWNAFGVWIPESKINDTEQILRAFTAEQKAEKLRLLDCAHRHLSYTTFYGGLLEEDTGEFDPVNTVMEILRARKRHPGLTDAQLMQADPALADFMACRPSTSSSSGGTSGGNAAGGVAPLQLPQPPLCRFNGVGNAYEPGTNVSALLESAKASRHNYCLPRNHQRPAHTFPGGSVTCPPRGPITQCRQY